MWCVGLKWYLQYKYSTLCMMVSEFNFCSIESGILTTANYVPLVPNFMTFYLMDHCGHWLVLRNFGKPSYQTGDFRPSSHQPAMRISSLSQPRRIFSISKLTSPHAAS